MEPLTIACTVRRSFPGPGGIATMMRTVTTRLAQRHRVRVFAARIDGEPFTRLNTSVGAQVFEPFWDGGVEVRPLPMGAGTLLRTLPMTLMAAPGFRRVAYQGLRRATAGAYARAVGARLASALGDAQVMHCWGGEHANWAGAEAARRRDLPVVVTPFAHPGAWGDDPLNAAFYARAAIVCALVPSEAAVYAGLGVDPARIRVTGVPVTDLAPGGPDVRARHGIGDDPLILFLGVKEPYKGYRTLLAASGAVWARHPRARFAFVGPPTDASREDFAALRDERVIEVGRVDDEEVGSWHRAATVFCLPSASEILPVSILEAWSAGTPVVAGKWWCAPDLIADGTDGTIVEPEDPDALAAAIAAMLDDPDAARAMGEAGRRKSATEYGPAVVAERHEAAYRDALSG